MIYIQNHNVADYKLYAYEIHNIISTEMVIVSNAV